MIIKAHDFVAVKFKIRSEKMNIVCPCDRGGGQREGKPHVTRNGCVFHDNIFLSNTFHNFDFAKRHWYLAGPRHWVMLFLLQISIFQNTQYQNCNSAGTRCLLAGHRYRLSTQQAERTGTSGTSCTVAA